MRRLLGASAQSAVLLAVPLLSTTSPASAADVPEGCSVENSVMDCSAAIQLTSIDLREFPLIQDFIGSNEGERYRLYCNDNVNELHIGQVNALIYNCDLNVLSGAPDIIHGGTDWDTIYPKTEAGEHITLSMRSVNGIEALVLDGQNEKTVLMDSGYERSNLQLTGSVTDSAVYEASYHMQNDGVGYKADVSGGHLKIRHEDAARRPLFIDTFKRDMTVLFNDTKIVAEQGRYSMYGLDENTMHEVVYAPEGDWSINTLGGHDVVYANQCDALAPSVCVQSYDGGDQGVYLQDTLKYSDFSSPVTIEVLDDGRCISQGSTWQHSCENFESYFGAGDHDNVFVRGRYDGLVTYTGGSKNNHIIEHVEYAPEHVTYINGNLEVRSSQNQLLSRYKHHHKGGDLSVEFANGVLQTAHDSNGYTFAYDNSEQEPTGCQVGEIAVKLYVTAKFKELDIESTPSNMISISCVDTGNTLRFSHTTSNIDVAGNCIAEDLDYPVSLIAVPEDGFVYSFEPSEYLKCEVHSENYCGTVEECAFEMNLGDHLEL